MKIIKLEKTCEECPTQWEFITDDNRTGYIRYRFGQLTIYISLPNEEMNYVDKQQVLWMGKGKDLDGTLSDERVFAALKLLDLEIQGG